MLHTSTCPRRILLLLSVIISRLFKIFIWCFRWSGNAYWQSIEHRPYFVRVCCHSIFDDESEVQFFDLSRSKSANIKGGPSALVLPSAAHIETPHIATAPITQLSRCGVVMTTRLRARSCASWAPRTSFPMSAGLCQAVGGKRYVVLSPRIASNSPDIVSRAVDCFARPRLLSVVKTWRHVSIVFNGRFFFLLCVCASAFIGMIDSKGMVFFSSGVTG